MAGAGLRKDHMFGPLFDDSIVIRRRKSAGGCGAKHISKSKVFKTEGFLMCQMSFSSQIDGHRKVGEVS